MVLVDDIGSSRELTTTLLQSVDLAIRDLLTSEEDPYSLAMYLWVLQRHSKVLVNSNRLATWGAAWVRATFVEGISYRRRDEQVASAALIVLALLNTPALDEIEAEVEQSLREILATELNYQTLPFDHPGYGMPILLLAQALHLEEPQLTKSLEETPRLALELLHGNRFLGIGFAVVVTLRLTLNLTMPSPELHALKRRIVELIEDPRTSYEDQVYLAQALCQMPNTVAPIAERTELVQQVISQSPSWNYLMVGLEDVPPASDGHAIVTLSHLLRAMLLDITLWQASNVPRQSTKSDVVSPAVRGVVDWAAFALIVLLLTGLAFLVGRAVLPWSAAFDFWIRRNYSAMSSSAAILSLIWSLLAALGAMLIVVAIWSFWKFYIRASESRDEGFRKRLYLRLGATAVSWFLVLVIPTLVNLWTGLIGPSLDFLVNGK
ncbi:MAG: hypothetical protein U0841_05415 [Chloroflexia bacterium]